MEKNEGENKRPANDSARGETSFSDPCCRPQLQATAVREASRAERSLESKPYRVRDLLQERGSVLRITTRNESHRSHRACKTLSFRMGVHVLNSVCSFCLP